MKCYDDIAKENPICFVPLGHIHLCYRMMMHDGIVGIYYPVDTIFYEYGSGISTSGDREWKKRLHNDWDTANFVMKSVIKMKDLFCAEIDAAMRLSEIGSKVLRFVNMPRKKWYFEQRLYMKFHRRKTRV